MKILFTILAFLFLSFSVYGEDYKLKDYVFKYEDGKLYYSHINNYSTAIKFEGKWFPNYEWNNAIPGELMKLLFSEDNRIYMHIEVPEYDNEPGSLTRETWYPDFNSCDEEGCY
jgi:hypothetical protein